MTRLVRKTGNRRNVMGKSFANGNGPTGGNSGPAPSGSSNMNGPNGPAHSSVCVCIYCMHGATGPKTD